jgi:hypothetical protein
VDRLTAIKKLLDRCIRKPNEQYAYSRCEVCDHPFWDREEHRSDCELPQWREALSALDLEGVRNEALEEATKVCETWGYSQVDMGPPAPGKLFSGITTFDNRDIRIQTAIAAAIRALKREPNAAGGA